MTSSTSYRTPLRIAIVCPAPAGSRLGNRVTALRWERVFRELGHEAAIVDDAGATYDVIVALHAKKSADAVHAWRARGAPTAERPLVVALTGTDLYRDIHEDDRARASLALADRLVVLHELAPLDVPADVREKVRVVRQAADPPTATRGEAGERAGEGDAFEVALVAHARSEKDPLRAPLAARLLPASSRVRVLHAGRALSKDVEAALVREARENSRYVWLGELAPEDALALVTRARLLVLTSAIEGGANVLGEAIVAGTPPLATRIPACIAALGEDYPGLFPVGDTEALARLLARAETDRAFYDELAAATEARRPLFAPSVEREAWRRILAELVAGLGVD